MDNDNIIIVDYSSKAFAIAGGYDTVLFDEFKLIGGRFNPRLKFGPGWIFSKKKNLDQILNLFAAYEIAYKQVSLSDIASTGTRRPKATETTLPDYIRTVKSDVIVTLGNGGTLTIKSSCLETEFWFGESDFQGPTYEEASEAAQNARTNEDYFISENLSGLRDRLSLLSGNTDGQSYKYLWLLGNDENRWELVSSDIDPETTNAADFLPAWERQRYDRGLYRPLSNDDRERLTNAYKHALDLREKRCRTYLKRYGLSKIRTRTYWMDR